MRLILLGAPGAGKGTQADRICKHFKIPAISTGNMLRAAVRQQSLSGILAEKLMKTGDLVPDHLIIDLVKERLQSPDCVNGFLFDGFPRTLPQACALRENHIHIDAVLNIEVPDQEIIARMSGRWIHPGSGRVYHSQYNSPKVAGIDDQTGEPLLQREDDLEETVRRRLSVYHHQTEVLVSYFQELSQKADGAGIRYGSVSGTGSLDDVTARILDTLQSTPATA